MNKKELKEKLIGKFIVFDGPDGSGKSTQIKLLADYLKKCDIPAIDTQDPGGTKIGDQIRRLLKYDAQGKMDVVTETFLFMASRAQLVNEIIKPSKELGKVVLCDRYISATCAYQGAAGYPTDKIIELGKFAVGDCWPELTLILDIDPDKGRERTGHQKKQKTRENHKDAHQGFLFENVSVDRFDSRTLEYHRKVRKEFLKLSMYYPTKVVFLDVNDGDIEAIHEKIKELILKTEF
ncbi:MAG: dTMP kinase [Planctomycetes bacterium]|nr:dTMP kinase [Planctomycetota bacterium]